MRASLFFVLFITLVFSGTLRAQDKQKLEEWQKRILEAMESQEQPSPLDNGRRSYNTEDNSGAARAAAAARRQHGGKVLAVVKRGDVYRVRLLRDDGHVTTVTVRE